MESNYGLLFHYKGISFDNKIEINSLKEVLNGIKIIGKQFDGKTEVFILPFEEGSFKFGVEDYKDIFKNVIGGVILGLITFYLFTKGEDYKVNVSNSTINGNIVIVNNNGEQKEFSQEILPYLGNEGVQNGLKKIVSPLNNENDELILNSSKDNKVKITFADKESFSSKDTDGLKKIRGFIYEMNIKRKTFKVLLVEGEYFTVKVGDNISMGELHQYLGTDAIELEGRIIKTKSGTIKKMDLFSYREVQYSLNNINIKN